MTVDEEAGAAGGDSGSNQDRTIYSSGDISPFVGRVLTGTTFIRASDFNSILIRRHTASCANFIIVVAVAK